MKSRLYWASEAARVTRAWVLPSPRVLRLSAYFSCVSLVLLMLAGRALYAATREDAFSIGHELLGLTELTAGAETVQLNGERFHHAVQVSEQPLAAVLDRVAEHCRQNPGPAALLLAELAASAPKRFEQHAPPAGLQNTLFREQSEARGLVLCFVGGASPVAARSWLAALRRFSMTRDLSAFGRLRYSFAERTESGRTRVVTLWADTGLNLSTLFPATGDAAGTDSSELPRPPAARRTLSASAEGMPFSVRSYELSQSLATTQRFYDGWMSEHGFHAAHVELGSSSYLRADGFQAFVSLLDSAGKRYVTVTETGRTDAQATLELGSEP